MNRPEAPADAAAIRSRLIAELARIVGVDPRQIDATRSFEEYGLASGESVVLAGDLERWLGFALEPSLLWDHPTIDGLASHLAGLVRGATVRRPVSGAG